MLSQVVKIVPKVGRSDLQKVERNFNRSFKRVSKTFGKGLKIAGALAAFQIGGDLARRLTEPLDKVDEKIKSLLGQGKTYDELADQLGTSTGTIRTIEDTAKLQGVDQDQIRSMMQSFFDSVRTAQQEIRDKNIKESDYSDVTKAMRNYVDRDDLGKAFISFLGDLRSVGRGAIAKDAQGNAILNDNPIEARRYYERMILGGEQYGASRRFIESDFSAQSARLGNTRESAFNRAQENLMKQLSKQNELQTKNERSDFLIAGGRVNGDMIESIEKRRAEQERRVTGDMANYENISAMKETVDSIHKGIDDVVKVLGEHIPSIASTLKNIMTTISTFFKSKIGSWFR